MRLIWSNPATLDLAAIDQWLATNANAELSVSTLERIGQRARRLRDFPRIRVSMTEGLRAVRVPRTPYMLVYVVRPNVVEIIRVRHQRENWRPDE